VSAEDERQALLTQVDDLRAERAELDALLATLDASDWERVTTFKDWRVWDVVAHLHLSDHMGVTSLAGEEPFRALMREMRDAGVSMALFARRWLGDIPGHELHARWRDLLGRLCDGLAATNPEQRLPWAGPSMKPRMFTTARQMETWAHGWEIYDLLARPRPQTDRLRNIATIGVRTFGWTFANRKLDAARRTAARGAAGAIRGTLDLERRQRHGSGGRRRRGVLPGGDPGAQRRRHPAQGRRAGRHPLDGDRPVLRRSTGGTARTRNPRCGSDLLIAIAVGAISRSRSGALRSRSGDRSHHHFSLPPKKRPGICPAFCFSRFSRRAYLSPPKL
jgi:uncharacterized protein (TIGR03084 family)